MWKCRTHTGNPDPEYPYGGFTSSGLDGFCLGDDGERLSFPFLFISGGPASPFSTESFACLQGLGSHLWPVACPLFIISVFFILGVRRLPFGIEFFLKDATICTSSLEGACLLIDPILFHR